LFVKYVGEQLLWSLDLNIKAAKGENIEETGDWEKEIELIKRKVADKSNIVKSPKLVYEVFHKCNEELWPLIKTTLEKFASLFNEEENLHYFNGRNEIVESIGSLISNSLIGNVLPIRKQKIFGYDIYDEDINAISWEQRKIGLRGTKKLTDYKINLTVNFEYNLYSIYLILNTTTIFTVNKSYTDSILTDELNELDRKLKVSLIEQIKKDTNGQ